MFKIHSTISELIDCDFKCLLSSFIVLSSEVDRFLQQSNVREDELLLLRPVSQRLDHYSSWSKACSVRVTSVGIRDNTLDLSVKLVTDESMGEALSEWKT